MGKTPQVVHYASPAETDRRAKFAQLVRTCPIPDRELLDNLGVFLNSKTVARLKFMDLIYEQIVEVPGVVMEFGQLLVRCVGPLFRLGQAKLRLGCGGLQQFLLPTRPLRR